MASLSAPLAAQGPPPPPNPMKPDPQAVAPNPLEVHVIAGSVVTLTPPGVCSQAYGSDGQPLLDGGGNPVLVPYDQDRWTSDNRLERDDSWYYKTTFSGGQRLSPLPEDVWRSNRQVTWQAPTSDCTVTATTHTLDTIWSSSDYGSNDTSVTYTSIEIHVHQLEVYEINRGGHPLYNPQFYPDTGPGTPHPWECDGWYDAPPVPRPDLVYSRNPAAGPHERRLLFEGEQVADLTVVVRGKGGYEGPVVPTNLRLYAPWTQEDAPPPEYPGGSGLRLSSHVVHNVASLPRSFTVYSMNWTVALGGVGCDWMPCPIDSRITYDWGHTWDWNCDVLSGYEDLMTRLWQYQAICPVDDAQLFFVATSHGPILLPPSACTYYRVAEVYEELTGGQDPADIITRTVAWLAEELTGTLHMNWCEGGGAPADTWCVLCQGLRALDVSPDPQNPTYVFSENPADGITGCNLGCLALGLVGVPADLFLVHPRSVPGTEESWAQAQACWAEGCGSNEEVGYWSGGANAFEATITYDGRYWAWWPVVKDKEHPYEILQSIGGDGEGRPAAASYGHYGDAEVGDECWISNGPDHVLVTAW